MDSLKVAAMVRWISRQSFVFNGNNAGFFYHNQVIRFYYMSGFYFYTKKDTKLGDTPERDEKDDLCGNYSIVTPCGCIYVRVSQPTFVFTDQHLFAPFLETRRNSIGESFSKIRLHAACLLRVIISLLDFDAIYGNGRIGDRFMRSFEHGQ